MNDIKPKWTILICTLGQRDERYRKLLSELLPQVKKYNGDIQVLVYWNNGERPLGEIRQALVDEATGKYISFIDDDDSVPDYYCDKVYPLLGKVDYIGWRMQAYHDGVALKPTFHSIKYDRWFDDENGFYRNISHLNPIKRSIAKKGSFLSKKDVAEDQPWSEQVAPFVKTESYIDDVMYYYHHNTHDSQWRGITKPQQTYSRPVFRRSKYFRYHPDSLPDFKPWEH